MRIYLTVFFLYALAVAGATAGIDFTPTPGERTLEGVVFKQLIFHQGGHKISYEPPRGWTYAGDAAQLKLSPPNLSQAQATMEQSPLATPQVLDDAVARRLQQSALAAAPSGAQKIALVSEERNPLRIDRQETYEAVISYNFFGQDYELSVLYANLPDTQLRFRTVARKGDFEKVHRAFRASLFSLSWL
jgi:hypothetical protein